MRRRGRVIAVEGLQATVCFETSEACERCEAKTYCHTSGAKHSISVENSVGAVVGDVVYVEQPPGRGLAAASLLFGLPVILALLGMLLGARWHETGALVLAVLFFGIGLLIAKLLNNIIARRSAFLPKITGIERGEGS